MLLKSYVNEILYFSLSLIIDLKHYIQYPISVIILLVSVGLHAQQEPAFTHYREMTTMYNPAYSGMREGISVNGLFRQQWAGFNDYETGDNVAPEDYLVTIDAPIRLLTWWIGRGHYSG